jgi:hypothetical protein
MPSVAHDLQHDVGMLDDFTLAHRYSPMRVGKLIAWVPPAASAQGYLLRFSILLVLILFAAGTAAGATGLWGPSSAFADLRALLSGDSEDGVRSIPFLRDYAFLGLLLLAPLSYAQLASQWERLESLPAQIKRGGLLSSPRIPFDALEREFHAASRRSGRALWELASLAAAGLITWIVLDAVLDRGIYPFLDGGRTRDLMSLHSENWWANPGTSLVGFIAYATTIAAFLYLHCRNTILGWHITSLLLSLQRAARAHRARAWFGYGSRWADPQQAIAAIRRAMLDAFLAVGYALTAGALAVYAFSTSPIVLAVVIAWAVWDIFVLVFPWVLLNRQLAASREQLLSTLISDLREIQTRRHTAKEGEWLWRSYRHACDLPDRVLNRLPVGAFLAFYLLPIAALIQAFRS